VQAQKEKELKAKELEKEINGNPKYNKSEVEMKTLLA